MRLLHTSDWHLGSRFYGRSLIDDQAYVLDQMVNLARDLKPDVTLICGDVFHQRRPGEAALALFHDTVSRLLDLKTTIVVVAGPADDFPSLHLGARWVRQQGLYLYQDYTQVLSPLSLNASRGPLTVNAWCLPYPGDLPDDQHPALVGRDLVERVVSRFDPGSANVFVGYAWAQGVGKPKELGTLVATGGQPLEQRLLEFFDYAALGGAHTPTQGGSKTIRYSGSLLNTDYLEEEELDRSVTFVEIESKGQVYVDQYPLRPRRSFKLLSGSWEELMDQGRRQRAGDLLILRSDETDLSSTQRAELRRLNPNVVSVELPSPVSQEPVASEGESELVSTFREFVADLGQGELDPEAVRLLEEIEGTL